MVVPGVGMAGQQALCKGRVLVVGCGGIGSTVIMYLAGAGVPLILCDNDAVEVTNLHRQIIHDSTPSSLGCNKAVSAANRARSLNPDLNIVVESDRLTAANARELVAKAHVVVDATDNYEARYLLNDACFFEGVPLVSGSAVGAEGQLCHADTEPGPCYRCLYPKVEDLQSCKSCADAGVLGPVPGLIGCMEAVLRGKQLMYDAASGSFHTFRLPKRSSNCKTCGDNPTITSMDDTASSLLISNAPPPVQAVQAEVSIRCISPALYASSVLQARQPHVLLDVRPEVQYSIASLENEASKWPSCKLLNIPTNQDNVGEGTTAKVPIYVLCRRGKSSISATSRLHLLGFEDVSNVSGGLDAWRAEVDPAFPSY
eukprot:GSChrysophyteH1.ASY1.ANO1.12.1 assembled CDS